MYTLIRPLLFWMPSETAHHVAVSALRATMTVPGLADAVRSFLLPADRSLEIRALGLVFRSPVGLAAGFDKNAIATKALLALGFGFVEVGTVTGQAQPGNPPPRLFRLVADRALINRMGFNNEGAEPIARRLGRRNKSDGVVGANIGKTKIVAEEDAVSDYERGARWLAPYADYVVVNVSSPNTPGLRNLQAVSKLEPLLRAVAAEMARVGSKRPLLVKIAPDLSDEEVDAVADLALALGLDGIIATNTTISRAGLRTSAIEVEAMGAGGLSGPPVARRSLEVLRRLRSRVGDRLVLISVGGIETVEDAWERIRAGATLIQIYTGFIYLGPFLAANLARGLARRAREEGFSSVQEAVGSAIG